MRYLVKSYSDQSGHRSFVAHLYDETRPRMPKSQRPECWFRCVGSIGPVATFGKAAREAEKMGAAALHGQA